MSVDSVELGSALGDIPLGHHGGDQAVVGKNGTTDEDNGKKGDQDKKDGEETPAHGLLSKKKKDAA